MHDEVLALLDAHLTRMQDLRRQMTRSTTIAAGARWELATASARHARNYADELIRLLSASDDTGGVAVGRGRSEGRTLAERRER